MAMDTPISTLLCIPPPCDTPGEIDVPPGTVKELLSRIDRQGKQIEFLMQQRDEVKTAESSVPEPIAMLSAQSEVPKETKRPKRRSSSVLGRMISDLSGTVQTAQTSQQSVGLHAWIIVKATDANASFCRSTSLLLLSIAVVLLPIIVLKAVAVEASFPRCNSHEQCNQGSWCAPSKPHFGGHVSVFPGACDDCSLLQGTLDEVISKLKIDKVKGNVGGLAPVKVRDMSSDQLTDFLSDAQSYCNETDTMPDTCDHMTVSRNRVSGANTVALIFSSIMVILPLESDFEQTTDEMYLLEHRLSSPHLKSMPRHQMLVIRLLVWCMFQLRRGVLPAAFIGATIGLLLSNPLTSTNILVNGLTVAFIAAVDDTLAETMLGDEERDEVQKANARVGELDKYAVIHNWLQFHTYAAVLIMSIPIVILNAETLMRQLGNTTCENILRVVTYIPDSLSVAVMFAGALLHLWHQRRGPNRLAAIANVLTSPVFVAGAATTTTLVAYWLQMA